MCLKCGARRPSSRVEGSQWYIYSPHTPQTIIRKEEYSKSRCPLEELLFVFLLLFMKITDLRRVDVVGHIHNMIVQTTKAFNFGHHRGLDASVNHLISLLVEENPTVEQREKKLRLS